MGDDDLNKKETICSLEIAKNNVVDLKSGEGDSKQSSPLGFNEKIKGNKIKMRKNDDDFAQILKPQSTRLKTFRFHPYPFLISKPLLMIF